MMRRRSAGEISRMGKYKINRIIFALGLLCAFASGAGAQEPHVAVPAPQPTLQVPALPPSGSALPITADALATTTAPAKPVFLHQGLLVENIDGETVTGQGLDETFNPASAIKLATALVALRNHGPEHRFATAVWTNGAFDPATGTINGDLVVSGRDPSFHYEHAVDIARELNRMGVRTVTGDLVVAPRFTMNFSGSSLRSGEKLYDTLDATRRPAAATRAWYDSRVAAGDTSELQNTPSVAVMGAVYVDSVPPGARTLLTHKSSTLVDILKVLLCYSNNFMAERIGDGVGGADGVRRFLVSELGLPESEVRVATTSGLGVNRLTPRGMMTIYRALLEELERHDLEPSDIMPVAGVDPGTLERRYNFSPARGSIIAKTGTLIRTDGGASALVGQFKTRDGETHLFVIFNRRGNVSRFRNDQDRLLGELQSMRGGPAPFAYTPQALAVRLSNTELDAAKRAGTEEYEPVAN